MYCQGGCGTQISNYISIGYCDKCQEREDIAELLNLPVEEVMHDSWEDMARSLHKQINEKNYSQEKVERRKILEGYQPKAPKGYKGPGKPPTGGSGVRKQAKWLK